MSFLRVTVDGRPVAVVGTAGRDVITIRIGGTLADDDYADLGVAAGTYPPSGFNDYRIWIDQMPLTTGQLVEVAHLEHDVAIGTGKTLEELHPDWPPGPPHPLDRAELAESVRGSPGLREGYVFEYTSTSRTPSRHSLEPGEYGFGFSVLWNSHRPERASVSLHCYSIETFVADQPGRTILSERLQIGSTVSLRFVA